MMSRTSVTSSSTVGTLSVYASAPEPTDILPGMAIGQASPRPLGAPTGQRVGGGIQRSTTARTTPLAPRPTTPLNAGATRRPAGMNAQMGEERPDRVTNGTPGIPNGTPGIPRTRALRPLVADRVSRSTNPAGYPQSLQQPQQFTPVSPQQSQPTPGQLLMQQTLRAYTPSQPQLRGPYSPTPATVQNFLPPGFYPDRVPG